MARGSLTVIYGPMFAGKSAHLIRAARGHDRVLCLAPSFDRRSGASLHSRAGDRVPARALSRWPDDVSGLDLVVIDEVQFLSPPLYEGDVLADILNARASGAHLVVAGLDTDYRRAPFPVTEGLISAADRRVKLEARCHRCGAAAAWTAKKHETGQWLETGDSELYEARCDAHWSLPAEPAAILPDRRRLEAGS